ncbi:Olfactory receptor, insect [Cinara cedri]|uniref:Olfactory receptor, insect n=1 Tax=Cinara cedri TaxID=506608 RepID=A0A5E4N7H5_9HEMI|nr:Olfactory receptor, insect [Cinara cedri]
MTVQLCLVTDLTMLARTIDVWTLFMSGIFKWVFMMVFNEEFAKLNSTLTQIHAQGRVAYGEYAADEFEVEFMKPTRKITWWYMFTGLIVTTIICLSPILSYPKGDRSDFEYYNDPKSYPLCCWIPFMLHEKWMFSVIFFSHALAFAFVVFMYLNIDSFFFGAIYAVGGQIELLKLSLDSIENFLTKSECEQ